MNTALKWQPVSTHKSDTSHISLMGELWRVYCEDKEALQWYRTVEVKCHMAIKSYLSRNQSSHVKSNRDAPNRTKIVAARNKLWWMIKLKLVYGSLKLSLNILSQSHQESQPVVIQQRYKIFAIVRWSTFWCFYYIRRPCHILEVTSMCIIVNLRHHWCM